MHTYSMTFDKGVFFDVLPVTLDGQPADLKGAVPVLANANPELFDADIEPDGRIKLTPKGVAGVGVITLSATVAGVLTAGTGLTVTLMAPLPAAQGFDFNFDSNFAL